MFSHLATRSLPLSAAVLLCTPALHAATTGWNQTAAGPFDYNNPANWVAGDINGVWDGSLTLADNQTVQFGADTVLDSGLMFLYDGSRNMVFGTDGSAPYTLTFAGDLLHNTVNSSRKIEIKTLGGQALSIDLGGATRTFDVRGTAGNGNVRSMSISDTNISNGGLMLQGGGTIDLWRPAVSLTDLTVRNLTLTLRQDVTTVNVSGDLTIDGAAGVNGSGETGGIADIRFDGDGQFAANGLARVHGGVVRFSGPSLGKVDGASATFTNAPTAELVGGGGATATSVSILPWAIGGTDDGVTDTFVTYGADGIRPLDPTTEFHTDLATAAAADNVRLLSTSGTTTLNSNATVNSLFLEAGGSGTTTVLEGTGTLKVTSGAIYLEASSTTRIDVGLDFGDAQGVIGFHQGKPSEINGAIAGTGGIVFYQSLPYTLTTSGGTGVAVDGDAANSTYTGDTHVLGRATFADGVLPSGARTGDVYVHGLLGINGGTINGLNGNGSIDKRFSGTDTFTLGDNDADGNFSGTIRNGKGSFNVTKIGAGTQVFSGENTYTGNTTVQQGTLVIDGALTATSNDVTVNDGILGGSGSIAGTVTISADGVLAPGSSAGTLTIDNSLTLGGESEFELESADSFDRVLVNTLTNDPGATLTFGGDLVVTDLGVAFAAGQVFDLFDWGVDTTVSGSFDSVVLPALTSGLTWVDFGGQGFDYSTGQIAIVPEPASLALLGLGGLLVMPRGRGRRR